MTWRWKQLLGSLYFLLLGSLAHAEEPAVWSKPLLSEDASSSHVQASSPPRIESVPDGWSRFGKTSLVTLGVHVGVAESQQQNAVVPGGLGGVQFQLQMPLRHCGDSLCAGASVDLALGFGSPDVRVRLRAEPLSIFIHSLSACASAKCNLSTGSRGDTQFTHAGWFWTPVAVEMMITGGGLDLDGTRMGNSYVWGSSRVGYTKYQWHRDKIRWSVDSFTGIEAGYVKDPEVGAGWFGALVALQSTVYIPTKSTVHSWVGKFNAELHLNGLGMGQSVGRATHGLIGKAEFFYRRQLASTALQMGVTTAVDWLNVVRWANDPLLRSDQASGVSVEGGCFIRVEGL